MSVFNLLIDKVRSAIVIIAFSLTCFPASANLIANAGFEEQVDNSIPPFTENWQAFVGSAGVFANNSTLMPYTGSQSLLVGIDNVGSTFAGVFQDIGNLKAGDDVVFSGWHQSSSLFDQGGVEIRIEWRNMLADIEISRTSNLVPLISESYSQFIINSIVPVGADIARLVYAVQSFGGASNQQVFVDETSFNVVPEPTTLTLFGMAYVGLIFAKRKKAS